MSMRVLSLFSGIGGFDLGLERAGMTTVAHCEINPFRQKVLRKHWPDVPIFDDITALTSDTLQDALGEPHGRIDVICGGFPCQDLSKSGYGAGLAGERSGLWFEFSRLISELRPRYVLVENVPSLLTGGARTKRWDRAPIGVILGELSEMGYDAEWSVLSAKEFGAPHLRKRVWLVANATDTPTRDQEWTVPAGDPRREPQGAIRDRLTFGRISSPVYEATHRVYGGGDVSPWPAEPGVRGVDDGLPTRLDESGLRHWDDVPDIPLTVNVPPSERRDRLSALGDSLVPQIAEWIGRRILRDSPEPVSAESDPDHYGCRDSLPS